MYRADIDGLRAIAVTAVVLFHAGLAPFRSGFVGVDIFFVISGFLIGGIIYRDASKGTFRFTAFYARRARRILPALFVVTTVTLACGVALLSAAELQKLGVSAASALSGVSNFRFWRGTDYFSPDAHTDPFLMTWSLGVEEQFYLLFPFVLLALRKAGPRTTLTVLGALALASLVVSAVVTANAPVAAFYLLPTRAWELCAGVLLAVWQAQGRVQPSGWAAEGLSVVGLSAVGVSVVIFPQTVSFPGLGALLPVLGAAALLSTPTSLVNRRILSFGPLVGVGLVSYSWYLWHWPLMAFLRVCSARPPPVQAMLAIGAVALVFAVISQQLIERPFRKMVLSDRKIISRYAVALCALMLAPIALKLSHGWPQRVSPQVARIEATVASEHEYPCLAFWGYDAPNTSSRCVSVQARGPSIAVIGDSHAAALGPGVQAMAAKRGWGSQVLAKSSCRPLSGVTVARTDQPSLMADCGRFMDAAFRRVIADPSVHTVVLAGLWSGPMSASPDERYVDRAHPQSRKTGAALLLSGLHQAVQTLLDHGKRVVVAQDVPLWTFGPARASIIQLIPARAMVEQAVEPELGGLSRGVGPAQPRDQVADTIVADSGKMPGARYLKLAQTFCGEECRYREGSTLLYVDSSHLSPEGAAFALSGDEGVLFDP
jgi:peptidoglycan/LPS O-acetylase OafA/YrhL